MPNSGLPQPLAFSPAQPPQAGRTLSNVWVSSKADSSLYSTGFIARLSRFSRHRGSSVKEAKTLMLVKKRLAAILNEIVRIEAQTILKPEGSDIFVENRSDRWEVEAAAAQDAAGRGATCTGNQLCAQLTSMKFLY